MWPFFNKPKKNIEPEVYFSEILRIKTNLQNRIWLADKNIQKLLGGKRVYESLLASNQYEPGKHGRSIGLFDVLKKNRQKFFES